MAYPPHTPHTHRLVLLALAACLAMLTLGAASAHAAYTSSRVGTPLNLFGDGASDSLRIARDAAGNILVDVGNDGTFETIPLSTVANTSLIAITAADGDDTILFDQAQGALPAGNLSGGGGNDSIVGGAGNDTLTGGDGNDTLDSKGGFDILTGDGGDDTLTGGDADDMAAGSDGNDRFVWNPGDDTDTNSGDAGSDVTQVNGGNGSEIFTLVVNGTQTGLRFERVDPAPFGVFTTNVERVRLFANGGVDTFTAGNNLSGLVDAVEVDLGAGSAESFNGSDVPDIVTGGQGTETVATEEGDDTFRWTAGDGSETADLGTGSDTVDLTGTDTPDNVSAQATGSVVQVALGGETIAADRADRIVLDTRGGNDTYTSSPSLTDVAAVDVSGGAGDDSFIGAAGGETFRGGDGADSILAGGGNDFLFGDAGIDSLVGSTGADSFACGGFGDSLDATPEDTVAADCLKPADQPTDGPTGGQPDPDPVLPAGCLGFSQPVVRGRTGDLTVTVTNTHSAAITVRVAGRESARRRAGAARTFRYRAVTRTIAPGAGARVTLRAPSRLRAILKHNLAVQRRIVRRPRITAENVTTAGKTTVRPRIAVRSKRS